MSKGIFLYSEDKKYKCAFELCDTLDKHQIPDHSVMVLFEEREDGHYVIAEARDKILTTEKDLLIASLELEKSDLVGEKADLEKQLAEKNKEIEELKTDLFVKNLDREYDCILGLQNAENDKINFAIEKLEKVKETLIQNADEIGEEYKEDYFMISLGNVKNIIDKQIKQLKEIKING